MKLIRKISKIIPLFTILYVLLFSFLPSGLGSNQISESRVIPAGSYLAYPVSMEEDDKIEVSFEVILGGNLDINVWVVDSANYLRYEDGESFYYKIGLERYVNSDFQYTAITSDTYYVIFSNTFSLITSKTVDIDIKYIPASNLFPLPLILGLIGGLLAIGVITLLIRSNSRSTIVKKKTSTVARVNTNIKEEPSQIPQTHKTIKKQFCTNCGAQLIENETNYCPYCGKFQS